MHLPIPPLDRAVFGRALRWTLVVCALAGVTITAPAWLPGSSALAQTCRTIDPPCPPDEPPRVNITTAASASTSDSALAVTIYVFDDDELVADSFRVAISGARGTGFSLALDRTRASGTSKGTLYLAPGGGNTITARICDSALQCTSGTASYTYTPPPPPPEKAAPLISLAPHERSYRRASECAACAQASLAYSTPAYVSMDVPRAATLLYTSAQAAPLALVQLDVTDRSLTPAERFSLRLRRPDGSYVTFTSGAQEIFYAAGNGTTRLAAQLDARSMATGAYDYTAEVRSWWGQATQTSTAQVRVLVVNEGASPFGWGWSMPGLQRIVLGRADGAAVMTEGDGSIAFFSRSGCDASGNCTYAPPAGDFGTLAYTAATAKYTRRASDGTTFTFGSTGLLERVADRFGNAVTLGYTNGLLTRISDPAGKALDLTYGVSGNFGAAGKLASIRDPMGRTSSFTYDAAGNLTAIQAPDGATMLRASYAADHRVATAWDRSGAATDVRYDSFGAVDTVLAPAVSTTDAGTVRLVTAVRSLERAMLPAPGTGTWGTLAARVLPESVYAVVTTPRGATTRVAVFRTGAPTLVEERDARDRVTSAETLTYNDAGQVLTASTAAGASTTYSWSGPQLVRVVEQNTGRTFQIAYEGTYNQPTRIWLNGALLATNYYGSSGRLDSARVDTSVTRYTYDQRGRELTVTDPEGHRTTRSYETAGMQNLRTIATAGGDGAPAGTTTISYDVGGRMASATDPLGRVVSRGYDLLNRDTSVTLPGALTTRYRYDDVSRTFTTVDPRGLAYASTANALGWVERETDPRGGIQRYAYDRTGNVSRYTNRRAQVVSITYDELGRPTARTADGVTTTFAYDTAGRWVAASNAESTDTLRTDALGRTVEEVTVRSGVRFAIQSTYDTRGERNALNAVGPWGTRSLRFGYDAALRLNYLKDFSGRATSLSCSQDGLAGTVTLPTGSTSGARVQVTTRRTALGLPATVAYTRGADPALGRRYTYDALGRLTSTTRGVVASTNVYRDEVRRSLPYDAAGRLAGYTDVHLWDEQGRLVCPDRFDLTTCYYETISNTDTLRRVVYSYDASGNRTDRGAVVETGSDRVLGVDGYALGYDADGNITRKYKAGVLDQTLTWNSLGQLVSAATNGVSTSFGYDGFGRRVRKTAGSGTSAVTTRYLLDGDQVVMDLSGALTPLREYSYYLGVDDPASVRRVSDGAIFYYATEAPGSVAGLVDSTGGVVSRYEYGPSGEAISATEGVVQPYRYAAREYDSETGLYYYRARYYDPTLGRFLSEDPIGLAGGMNPYAYVGNDPANARDPSGLLSCPSGTRPVYLVDVKTDEVVDSWCEPLPRGGGGGGSTGEWYDRTSGWAPNPSDRGPSPGSFNPGPQDGWSSVGGGGSRGAELPSQECVQARISLAATTVGDVAFFVGMGGPVTFVRLGARAAGTFATRSAYFRLAAIEGGGVIAGYYNEAWQQSTTWTVPDLTWKDFVPGFATYQAYQRKEAACGGSMP